MKKILYPIILLVSVNLFSQTITCPEQIVCNYKEGDCDYPNKKDWFLNPYSAISFDGERQIKLSHITGYKRPNEYYGLQCTYSYGENSFFYLFYNNNLNLMGEKWIFSGFGKLRADCVNMNSFEECAGEMK